MGVRFCSRHRGGQVWPRLRLLALLLLQRVCGGSGLVAAAAAAAPFASKSPKLFLRERESRTCISILLPTTRHRW